MVYVTVRQHRKPVQLKFEDVLFGNANLNKLNVVTDKTGTVTRCLETVPREYLDKVNIDGIIKWLKDFNQKHKNLFEANRESLYRHFKIPKKTGGWRPIDQPNDDLQSALGDLAWFITEECGVLYHTSAFAYVPGRCTIDAVRRHANFGSNWFLKTDVSGFFPHTTLDFTMQMLSMIFPLSEVMKREDGRKELINAISLGFLNSGLPQGTKLSPALTNIIMIPIDHMLFNEFANRAMVYTRYADDMHISSKENFPFKKMVDLIKEAFKKFDAPYRIKDEKTHYGSVKGSNWLLGVMCNGNHEITVGHRNKKYFKAMITNLILDTKNNKPWDVSDVQTLYGLLSYYRMIEKEYFNKIIAAANKKWNTDVEKTMKSYLLVG